ncbi:uncharacterized protein TM35_000471170 [Trypanosoma theileri]|uniref:Titin n=1 Tax=Trypanosoma theileri TaxID=67003 RepID=A0A1X0NHI1_9TRYP|nr:uncharacterized protein TM35_000471170 [Trypanosoma theileri]ORC84222.1 hypothetical protein TM35_000471170 [Trypanosoma theileri]
MLLRFFLCALILFLSVPSVCGAGEKVTLSSGSSPRECPRTSAADGAAECSLPSGELSHPNEQCVLTEGNTECSNTPNEVQVEQLHADREKHGDESDNRVSDHEPGRGESEIQVTEETVTSELNGHQTGDIKRIGTPTPPPPGNGSHDDSTIEGTELPAQPQPAGQQSNLGTAQSQQNTMEVQRPTTTGEDEPKSNDTTPNTESAAQTTPQPQEDNGTQSPVADAAGTPASPSPEGTANTANDTTTHNEESTTTTTTTTTTLPPELTNNKKSDADSSSSISSSVWVRVPLLIVFTLACILVC